MSTPADFIPLRTLSSFAQDYPQLAFIIEQFINKTITIVPVRVVSVQNSGSLTSDCYVTVQPLLRQRLENGTGSNHGEIANVPCFRLRSGDGAMLLDPNVGDVGIVLAAYRDSSSLVAQDQASPGSLQGGSTLFNPGSAAKYDWGSSLYIGGWFNGLVAQFIQFLSGITLSSPGVSATQNFSVGNGASGSFSTAGGQTVDVLNGIVTFIG